MGHADSLHPQRGLNPAWDPAAGRHAYLRHADLVLEADRVRFIGRLYSDAFDIEIPGTDLLVMSALNERGFAFHTI